MPAGYWPGERIIVRLSEDIDRPKKVKKPTARPKIVVDMV
jgi:hypothetical protein